MDNASTTLNRLIEENKQIQERLQTCQMTISYLTMAEELDDSRETFLPGQSEPNSTKAVDLEAQITDLGDILRQHFNCEEESAFKAFDSWKISELILPIEDIITEHEHIFKALTELKKQTSELFTYEIGLSLHLDNSKQIQRTLFELAYLIKTHAGKEEALYREAKRILEEKNIKLSGSG